ncbi:MAG: SDR family oxidoreductase [Deltaproteobacteria bacterium]|nr:SDR family oxidoreductase [Deltaproteobacteria bacterium]
MDSRQPETASDKQGRAEAGSAEQLPYRSVLVTGAGGYLGRQLIAALADDRRGLRTIVASDIRLPPEAERRAGVEYAVADVRSADLRELLARHRVEVVVHLAAIVTPGRKSNRELEYQVDVLGTQNVLQAGLAAGVRKLIYTSSGAAYGYHADNPPWLDEHDALRGNPEFAYSDHKRLVEEMLARWRHEHPQLLQLIFRPGTILGARTKNQITDLFDKRYVLGLSGASSPFVIIWDQDVVGGILRGLHDGGSGIFNMAGDGTLTLREIAALLHRPYLAIPPGLISGALWLLKKLGLTQYGPEQVNFLRYRPVLANRRLKEEFGYIPRKSTREVFELFVEARGYGAPA